MYLLTEQFDTKAMVDGGGTERKYFIEGIFAQADTPNRNKRTYPMDIMEREIAKYQKKIDARRSLGQLEHSDSPTIDLDRISHYITEMKFEGNNIMGKAKIMDTPCGKIVKALIDEDLQVAVSTRGVGSLSEQNGLGIVQPDFELAAVDVVHDPSGIDCFVEGLMENAKQWEFIDGVWREAFKKTITKLSVKQLEEQRLLQIGDLFKTFRVL